MTDAGTPSFTMILLAGVFGLILCAPAFALDRDRSIGQFLHTTWSEKEGAPGQITALAQSADGYLWIGSIGGLFRFDGVKFEEYKPQPGVELPSHSIYALMPTPDGGLWIAFRPHETGFLKGGSLTLFNRPEEVPDSPIHSFARDQDGRIWGGTETGLVLRQGTRWVPIGNDWNFTPEMIRELFVDREGTLWVATVRVITFLKRGAKAFELAGPVGRSVTAFSQARDGRVWYAEGERLVHPVPMAGQKSAAGGPAVVADGLSGLLFDRDGALWITRLDSGIVRIRFPEKLGTRKLGPQDSEWESFDEKGGFTDGFAFKLLEDREGNIWVGCSHGLMRFRHNQVVPVRVPARYEELVLHAGDDNDLWVGTTARQPLLHLRGESLEIEKAGQLASSVFRDSSGDVWWGCRNGIWRQSGTEFNFFPLPPGLVPDWTYEIFPSRDEGGLWAKFGDIGIVHFQQGVWNLHAWPKGLPAAGTFRFGPSATYIDSSGRVWLGYSFGQVCLIEGDKVAVYSQADGLDVGRIKVIRGFAPHIWVGGELGLMFFSEGHFRRVRVADGEQLGAVSGIIETADSGLWLNEMRGIVQIPPEEVQQFVGDPNHLVNYRRFDYLDGLPTSPQMNYTNSTAVEARDGRLWFATDHALAWIDPKHIIRNVVPPPISILSIGTGKGRQPMSNAVRFAPGTHAVEIDYTALSLSIPERVEFRYKLQGVDADWQNVGNRRQAYYSNLGPGWYRFRVIACNNDGVWNDAGASLDFSIAPAYYETTWFRVMCGAAILVLLWTLYRLRLRSLERLHLERRHAQEALRRAQADLQHVNRVTTMGELTASLAHEVNQPVGAAVTDANTCLRWLAGDVPNVEEARAAASRAVKDARRAAEVIGRIRLLFKKGAAPREWVDINTVIQELTDLLHSEATRYDISIRTELADNLPRVMGDYVQLQQVMLNLTMNSIEATKEVEGVREIAIQSQREGEDQVRVSVRDSGVGLPPQQQADQVFHAFFTTKTHGTGMGLSICRSIVESHGGRMWADRNSPRGACFYFILPVEAEVQS
jgi:signal transduction histidine kinase/ligand-binding sensor domain-containing protein